MAEEDLRMDTVRAVRQGIEELYEAAGGEFESAGHALFERFKSLLNSGTIRAAEKTESGWKVNDWVKKGVLLGFRGGVLADYSIDSEFRFFDKSTFPLKKLRLSDGVRQVPGGSSIRDGSYVAPGVVIMPPAYINVGAWVDEGSMIDSHALVGSCAQVGKRVHLSAGAQIGGVLEPVGAMPVIIEDEVLVGGNCGVYEGTIVSERAVIGAGTILTGSTPVIDLVREKTYRRSGTSPLLIPPGGVVVPGSRSVSGKFSASHGISVNCALIVKYRDERTDAATLLEEALR